MSWKVIITTSAKRQLKKLPGFAFDIIFEAIDQLGIDPFNFSDLHKLSDRGETWRIRIRNYRIKFELF